jgi:hypothetical protein
LILKRENFFEIDGIPTLGTGKVDLKKVKEIAMERAGNREKGPVIPG